MFLLFVLFYNWFSSEKLNSGKFWFRSEVFSVDFGRNKLEVRDFLALCCLKVCVKITILCDCHNEESPFVLRTTFWGRKI